MCVALSIFSQSHHGEENKDNKGGKTKISIRKKKLSKQKLILFYLLNMQRKEQEDRTLFPKVKEIFIENFIQIHPIFIIAELNRCTTRFECRAKLLELNPETNDARRDSFINVTKLVLL